MVAEGPDRTAVTGFFDADAPNWDSVYRRADVFGIIHQLRREICLRWVAEHTPELESDRTARRELYARLAVAEQNLRSHLEWVFSPANPNCTWTPSANSV